MSDPKLSDIDWESDAGMVTADENNPIVHGYQSDEDNQSDKDNQSDEGVKFLPAVHFHRFCALCTLCLRCGEGKANCLCVDDHGSYGLKAEIYKDITIEGTPVATFLSYRSSPLPQLLPGQLLRRIKLCSYKGNGCHKKYSNWKDTAAGREAIESAMESPITVSKTVDLPLMPQTREKPTRRQKAPKKAKVSKIITLDHDEDAENGPLPIKTTPAKKETTVQLSVSLHTSANNRGISTCIYSAKVVMPAVTSLEELWDHLEKSLEAWEPHRWDRNKLHYIEGNTKSPTIYVIRGWLQFVNFLEMFETSTPAKKLTLIIRQVASDGQESGKKDGRSRGTVLDRADSMITATDRLAAVYNKKCAENPDSCLHDNKNGVQVHLRLTTEMKIASVTQIVAKTVRVDFHNPPTSLDAFNLEHYKPARNKWSSTLSKEVVQQNTECASGSASTIIQFKKPSPKANAQLRVEPQTIRFFGRNVDSTVYAMTGKIAFEESDTISTMLLKAEFPTKIAGKRLSAWEKDSDRQFLFDGKLKSTLTHEHTDIVIKGQTDLATQFNFY
ncbi:hypothetical protein HDU78_007586 [Chytriomyces hyalinus]|nr:hypothetical protein HDU78_007586 [Chytriomyces hyalinus]